MNHQPTALSIAGSDPSGGAGIQADLKVFQQHRVYGMAVITLLTVQNTQNVKAVSLVDPALVSEQLEAVLDDIAPGAIKTGALGSEAIISEVAKSLSKVTSPIVIDPVMISKHGAELITNSAVETLRSQLFPLSFLITPNIPEAERLTGQQIGTIEEAVNAGRELQAQGAKNVLIKGGHHLEHATDVLIHGDEVTQFPATRIDTQNTHGTGCVLSSAITARLSLGTPLAEAIRRAKDFVSRAISQNPNLGKGVGPTNLMVSPDSSVG